MNKVELTARFWATFVVLSSLFVSTRPAAAFRLIGAAPADGTYCSGALLECGDDDIFARWFTMNVPLHVNEDAAADHGHAGLSQSDIIGATQASAQSWEDVSTSIVRMTYIGETSSRLSGTDFENTLVFFSSSDDVSPPECVGAMGSAGATLAITILTEIAATGEITDVDVLFDTADTFEWNTTCDEFELQSVLTHEYGHALGIHHSDVYEADIEDRPTMYAFYDCDAGLSSLRTLEADDAAAAACLYPESPTLLLIDQTGSMDTGTRLIDAKTAATDFVGEFADNTMAVAAFADPLAGCDDRSGYELLEDWTTDTGDLTAAIDGITACGTTPLWEAACCAIVKADEESPANVLVLTDTNENSSDGDCESCITGDDVLTRLSGSEVTFYVVDITDYSTPAAGDDGLPLGPEIARGGTTDAQYLQMMADQSGGLYFKADDSAALEVAMASIRSHIGQYSKARQFPPQCSPGQVSIDTVQRYGPQCTANSPYHGQTITLGGVITTPAFSDGSQYLQDCSGGLRFTAPQGESGQVGQRVRIEGIIDVVHDEIALIPMGPIQVLGSASVPRTAVIDPLSAKLCEMIGSLVSVRGFAEGPVVNGRFRLVSDLGTPQPQTIVVYLDPSSGITASDINPGGYYVVTGAVGRGPMSVLLQPRDILDIEDLSITDVAVTDGPAAQSLKEVHPNPGSSRFEIRFTLSSPGRSRLSVYDAQGREVRRLVDGELAPSEHQVEWDGRDGQGRESSSGVYFVRLRRPDGKSESRGFTLIR